MVNQKQVVSHYSARTNYAVNSCEKFQLHTNVWTNLPNMQQPRVYFNPCLFNAFVYLSGAQVMEVFSPEHDTMLPVQIPLPEVNECCVYVDKDLLVLHSKTYIVKFEAGQNGQLRQRSKLQVPAVDKWSNSQPVVDRTRGVFSFVYDGKCVQVELETGKGLGSIRQGS